MSNDNILPFGPPGPPGTPAANLMRQLLDQVLNLGVLGTGNRRRSARDMLSSPQIDLNDPAAVQAQVRPLRDDVAQLKKHLDRILTVAGEARREVGR